MLEALVLRGGRKLVTSVTSILKLPGSPKVKRGRGQKVRRMPASPTPGHPGPSLVLKMLRMLFLPGRQMTLTGVKAGRTVIAAR